MSAVTRREEYLLQQEKQQEGDGVLFGAGQETANAGPTTNA